MVVFDTSFLALAFDSNFKAPIDPATGEVIQDCKERVNHLISTLSHQKIRILVPTPVIAEYLVRAGIDRDQRLNEFTSTRAFLVAPFDTKSAIECSILLGQEISSRAEFKEIETKAKMKFDRQIVAIAKSRSATRIYTGDKKLAECAVRNGISATMTWELDKPPMTQQALPL